MSFYDPQTRRDGFALSLASTSEVLERFHRTLMDRRQEMDWSFDASSYPSEIVEEARRQWSHRAIAEYESTAQFAQLLHRLTLLGVPIELIGAATRLATDECRHAELCARYARALGGFDVLITPDTLTLYDNVDDLIVAATLTILAVCCFGETLSVPMFRALVLVTNDPLGKRVAEIIASDEEYHSRFGWEALPYLTSQMTDAQREEIALRLPELFGHFERICFGSPEVWARMAGTEFEIEESDAPNLGTLPHEGYAAIFYATVEEVIMPRLKAIGFDAGKAWNERVIRRS